ncbi:peptidylprolyl isomerase [Leadbettera azotonutricia]|uniref:Periplasmic chaperone PpiD n=1 Tax=Leadbettera azotonutricia (strain ATCC BAA-888 / DSM 13862 / ZAS-9) TaxID=545695 RepID=F5Y7C0_LEAAZ|nr:SurA N-terminal domain-containing protein [Leadbettera azotonutricia]AEF81309.1 hypothetical protein TREAZ_3513 [Leadbettera azotonutricia ZAS-9]
MALKEKKLPEKQEESIKNDFVRRFKANPFIFIGTIVILIIVIVAFVLVPAIVPSAQGGAGLNLTFGSYNKAPISYVEGNYFYQVQQNMAQQYQSSLTESNYQFVLYQIWRQAFESAVVHAGILDEMKQAGYVAPEDVVDREVALLPEFQENGRFSAAKYRQLDNNRRLALWRQVQDSVSVGHYVQDLTELKVSSQESSFVSDLASPQRKFDLVAFPVSAYPDSEVVSYAQANPQLFKVTHLSRITINSSERDARQILGSIQDGTTTFEDAAKANSQDSFTENGGDMGIIMAYELASTISDETIRQGIVNLSRGSFSDVLAIGEKSWAFFRAEEEPHNADTSDTSVVDKIRSYVMSFERGKAEDYTLAEAEKFTADAREAGFDSAIGNRAIEKKSFGPIPVNYGDTSLFPSVSSSGVTELGNASTNENFWQAAFGTSINSPSSPFVLGDNVIVLYPTEETVSDPEFNNYIGLYYSYWLNDSVQQGVSSYFLSNGKLDDRFWDVFQHIWNTN